MPAFVRPLSRFVRRHGRGAGGSGRQGFLGHTPGAGQARQRGVRGARAPPLRPDLPLAPGSLPRAAVGESPGMTVRNTRALAGRDGAGECYFFIMFDCKGWPPARAGHDATGGGLTDMRDSATLPRAEQ